MQNEFQGIMEQRNNREYKKRNLPMFQKVLFCKTEIVYKDKCFTTSKDFHTPNFVKKEINIFFLFFFYSSLFNLKTHYLQDVIQMFSLFLQNQDVTLIITLETLKHLTYDFSHTIYII